MDLANEAWVNLCQRQAFNKRWKIFMEFLLISFHNFRQDNFKMLMPGRLNII